MFGIRKVVYPAAASFIVDAAIRAFPATMSGRKSVYLCTAGFAHALGSRAGAVALPVAATWIDSD